MILERVLWWAVLGWCVVNSWRAMRRADRLSDELDRANPEGSRVIARCVLKIREGRQYAPAGSGFTVDASHPIIVRGQRYLVTVKELPNG